MIGLWIITSIGLKNEEKIFINKIEKSIFDRMSLLEKLKDDVVNKFTLDLLEQKKKISKSYSSSPNKWFELFKLDKKRFLHLKTLDYQGNYYFFDNKYNIPKFKEISVLYRLLSDMQLLDLSTKKNKNNQNQNILLSTYSDALFKIYNSQNILAKESHLIPTAERLKDKVSYQLISSEKSPNTPKLLAFNFIDFPSVMKEKLNRSITQKYPELLSQEVGLSQIKYAIFERSESDYSEPIKQAKIYPFRQLQLDCAKKAIIKKSSGSEIESDKDNYYLKIWRYYNDNPLLFTAAAIIPKSQITIITGKIIALILMVYGLFVVALLSDFFSNALLEPIRTLTKFVKEIGLGHFNVKVNMKTGDEMEELGDSFNRMSEGLCEREKLKRFVSDKLYSSIANSNEQKITKAKVTILSSDIRSFTTISEKNSPEEVVTLLNDYFTLMEKSITKYGGSIEKIVGDAISAAFYEEKNKNYSINACKAALEMRESLKKFNQERLSKGLFTIENGVGLASGEVMIGFAGKNARRKEFLLIGEILKAAEKLESMTKAGISSKVYIDEQTFESIKGTIEVCPAHSMDEIFYRELKI